MADEINGRKKGIDVRQVYVAVGSSWQSLKSNCNAAIT
jgi:hypothetical protein